MRNIIFIAMGLLITGCANLNESKYNDPAKNIQITLPAHGSNKTDIIGTLDDGTKLVGKYSSLSDKTKSINSEFSVAQKASLYSWTFSQGITLKSTGGKDSLIIDCVYAVVTVPSISNGRCLDNKGNTYRIRF